MLALLLARQQPEQAQGAEQAAFAAGAVAAACGQVMAAAETVPAQLPGRR